MSRLSGANWPPALRRKLGIPRSSSDVEDSDSDSVSHASPSASALALAPLSPSSAAADSILSAHQLRRYIHRSYAALASMQRQLHRGEEAYFEETYAHGNLMQGWDSIWIEHSNSAVGGVSSAGGTESIDGSSSGSNGGEASAAGGKHPKSVPIRKMPPDHRWFSSSCVTVPATGDGSIAALELPSLIERPPTPEVKDEEIGKTTTNSEAQQILATAKVGSIASSSITNTKNAKVKNVTNKIVRPKTGQQRFQKYQIDGMPSTEAPQPPFTPPVKSSSVSKLIEAKIASSAKDQTTSASSTESSFSIISLPQQRTAGISRNPSSAQSHHQLDPLPLSANPSLNSNPGASSKSDVNFTSNRQMVNAALNLKAANVATDEAPVKGESAIQVTAVASSVKGAKETITIKTKGMPRKKDGRQRALTKSRDGVKHQSPPCSPLSQLVRARASGCSPGSKLDGKGSPRKKMAEPNPHAHGMAIEPPVTIVAAGTKLGLIKPDVAAALSPQKPPLVSTPARRVGSAAVQRPDNDGIDDVPLSSLAGSLEAATTPTPLSSASSGGRRMSSRITRKRKAAS